MEAAQGGRAVLWYILGASAANRGFWAPRGSETNYGKWTGGAGELQGKFMPLQEVSGAGGLSVVLRD